MAAKVVDTTSNHAQSSDCEIQEVTVAEQKTISGRKKHSHKGNHSASSDESSSECHTGRKARTFTIGLHFYAVYLQKLISLGDQALLAFSSINLYLFRSL